MNATTNRIDQLFERTRSEGRAALILFLTSGFPDEATTRRLLPVLERAGCDLIELGVPFSDPIADGPVIQQSSTVALANGMTLNKTLSIVTDFRRSSQLPLILFGAYNPFLAHGVAESAADAARAGADGFLAADLPVEESAPLRAECEKHGLHVVTLVAPTSGTERLRAIAASSRGFLYCIAFRGITGSKKQAAEGEVESYMSRVRAVTPLPRALGFGISTPAHVAQVAPHCEGVVVGSALVQLIERCRTEGLDLERTVGDYVAGLAAACRRKS